MIAHAVERSLVKFDLGEAKHVTCKLHSDACLCEVGQRFVMVPLQGAGNAAAHEGLAEQCRLAAPLEQRQRVARVLFRLCNATETDVDRSEQADNARALHRVGLGRHIGAQLPKRAGGDIIVPRRQIDFGVAQT